MGALFLMVGLCALLGIGYPVFGVCVWAAVKLSGETVQPLGKFIKNL